MSDFDPYYYEEISEATSDELEGVTRLEIITQDGRDYVKRELDRVTISLQDEGRTLKIFTEKHTKEW